ncbi:MAG TPA: hypothetical protein VF868_01395 [Bacteroidia bacterium]
MSLISGSLILSSYLSGFQTDQFFIQQRLTRNAYSGLNLLRSDQKLIGLNSKISVDLFLEGSDSVEMTRKIWGAYEILISRTKFKNIQASFIALSGSSYLKEDNFSIYLADDNKPLALSGNTIIKGLAYLPGAGVTTAYVDGKNYSGSVLIDGTVKKSQNKLPEFNKDITGSIKTILSAGKLSVDDSVIAIGNTLENDSIYVSHLQRSLVFRNSSALRISDIICSGNIGIVSSGLITISSSAELNDVVVYARKVIVEEGFKGSIQVFASDSIIIQKNVNLNYPSVLGLIPNSRSPDFAGIVLNENDTLSGSAFAWRDEREKTKKVGIVINAGATVTGEVFSSGTAEVRGTINGSLMCNKITLQTSSSAYENHLLDARIIVAARSPFFTGINLVKRPGSKKTVKWLN